MERQDLSIGCEFCEWQVEDGHRELAFSRWFEEFDDQGPEPQWPQQLELAMSNTCNLQCAMCNGDWSSSIRTKRDGLPPLPKVYDDAFFEELESFLPHLFRLKFLGGEPFLASETLRVMEMLVEGGYRPKVHVTTNGTQWTPRVRRLFDELPIEVAVSLDAATPEVYEQVRIGSSWDLVQENLDHFQERAAHVTVTYCLMTTNWQDFGAFCQQADARGIGCAVNVVTEPAHMSLYRLPKAELAEVIAGLDRIDREIGSTLTLSRATWQGELVKLRGRLQQVVSGQATLGLDNRKINKAFPRPFGLVAEAAADDFALLEDECARMRAAHLGTRIARLELDEFETISAVWPDEGVFGLPPDTLIGHGLSEMLGLFGPSLGDIEDLETLEVVQDVAAFEARFADGTVIRSLHGPLLDDGGRRPGAVLEIAGPPDHVSEPVSAD